MNHQAIYNIHPEVVSVVETLGAFDKDGNNVVLDQGKVDVETARLKALFDAQEYARKRAAEYPSIAELTVALYDTDDKAAIETKRAAVKAKYPKPS